MRPAVIRLYSASFVLATVTFGLACSRSGPESAAGDQRELAPPEILAAVQPAVSASYREWEIDNFVIHSAAQGAVTPADKANGLTERWCMSVAFIGRLHGGPWVDRAQVVRVVRYTTGVQGEVYGQYFMAKYNPIDRCTAGEPPR